MRVYGHTRTMMRGTVGMSVLALACTQPAFAQSGPANESEIVVTGITATTATKTDTPILRIPQAIEVVTIEEIQDRGAQNIREALKYTAGVYNGGDDSRGALDRTRVGKGKSVSVRVDL